MEARVLRRLMESRDRRLAQRGASVIGAMAFQADRDRWNILEEALGESGTRRLMLKWNMDRFPYRPGDAPPRPRSLLEWAESLGIGIGDLEVLRKVDQTSVEAWKELVAENHFPKLLCVPIDGAQEWWDSQYGAHHGTSGKFNPVPTS